LAANAGATANTAFPLGTTLGTLVLQVSATNSDPGAQQNYEIQFFDGSASGTLLYIASGITDLSFIDNGCFFVPPLTSGSLYVLVTNIDADAMTLALKVKTLGIQ
jgi:hypothetical protein